MDLGNLVETVVHYLLVSGMTYFGHPDEFTMLSVLVCIVTN